MTAKSSDVIKINVGGHLYKTLRSTLTYVENSRLRELFMTDTMVKEDDGTYFIDRDPSSFGVILNYLRLKSANQLWEACLPKDPDRLALLTQEAEYFRLNQLREQVLILLQCYTEKSDFAYVSGVMAQSFSCPQGFGKRS